MAVAALLMVARASAACSGADPAIVSASVGNGVANGDITNYTLTVRVVNKGAKAQPSNVLQFASVFEHGIRLDTKGIPPLRPGQGYTFTYTYQRSSDAGSGTSTLKVQLNWKQPSPPGSQDCNTANDRMSVTF